VKNPDAPLHALAGPYALDALSAQERDRYERHLTKCETCAQEMRELRETAARLAGAARATPPAELKERVLLAAANTAQLPPVTAPALIRRRRVRMGGMAGLTAAIAALIALVAVNNTWLGGHPQGSTDSHIAAVLTAPDALTLTAAVHNGGTSTIVMSPHEGALVFAAAALPPLPRTECYELWLIRGAGDVPASRLPPSVHGMTGPVVATGVQDHDRLGLSIEPARGSSSPTTPMLIDITL
jgi:anti-sigma factor RsiW